MSYREQSCCLNCYFAVNDAMFDTPVELTCTYHGGPVPSVPFDQLRIWKNEYHVAPDGICNAYTWAAVGCEQPGPKIPLKTVVYEEGK